MTPSSQRKCRDCGMKYKKPTIMRRLARMHWKTNRIWADTVRYAVHAYRMSSNSCLYISFASTSYSWSHNITIGRSSDLDIIILIRLPSVIPVTLRILNVSVQDYGIKTPSLQRRVRAGLAPASLFTRALKISPGHRGCSVHLGI